MGKDKICISEGYRRAANDLRRDAKMYQDIREDNLNRPAKECCSDAWLEAYNQLSLYCSLTAERFEKMADTFESFGQ